MSKELKNYVAGRWIGSDTTFDKVSPFDGAHVATVHEASATLVEEAVTQGHEVSIGSNASIWGDLPMKQRLAVIHDLADRLEARVEDLVEAEVADTGRSYWQASVFDGARAARLFRSYADAAASCQTVSALQRLFDNGTSLTKAAGYLGTGRSTTDRLIRETSP